MTNKTERPKVNLMTSFIQGAARGADVVLKGIIPAVVFAFALVRILMLSGALDLVGRLLSPLMAIFGLPGEMAVPLVLTYASIPAAISSLVSLLYSGVITPEQLGMVIPFIFLVGESMMYTARVLTISELDTKDYWIIYTIATISGFISIYVMRIIITFF